ncbi:MAG: hypothetical protein LBI28_11535, partial [Treponema sp.]|nr:hypothetical protein [Treponema sp.]
RCGCGGWRHSATYREAEKVTVSKKIFPPHASPSNHHFAHCSLANFAASCPYAAPSLLIV